jgi:hypothetical protein
VKTYIQEQGESQMTPNDHHTPQPSPRRLPQDDNKEAQAYVLLMFKVQYIVHQHQQLNLLKMVATEQDKFSSPPRGQVKVKAKGRGS